MAHNAFSCYDTISEVQSDEFSKNMGFFQASVFVQNGVSICSRSRSLSGRMWFLLMKQGCASPATESVEFFEEMERDFLKKHTKFEFGQTITYVLGCNTIRWTEIAC